MALGNSKKVTVPFQDNPSPRTSPLRSVYDAAASTQAEDYDKIMGNYDDILNNARSSNGSNSQNKLNYVPINPVFSRPVQTSNYQRSGDFGNTISGLEEIGRTGGYSDEDIGNIRERSISPIRSIYDSAQRGIDRQKVLQGGYSPNHGAVTAKMAREASSRVGDITTKVNADIAQMVAQGKLSALNSLGSLTGRENELINATNQRNTDLYNEVESDNVNEQRRVDELNKQLMMAFEQMSQRNKESNTNTQLDAVRGKQSLYGTTPALTQTFANQVLQNNAQNMQANQTANMLKNQRANMSWNLGTPEARRG